MQTRGYPIISPSRQTSTSPYADRDADRYRPPARRRPRAAARPVPVPVPRAAPIRTTRTPMLLRATMVAGLVAATGVSALRAYDGGLDQQAQTTLGARTTAVAAQAVASPVQSCRVTHTVTSRSKGRFTAVLTIVNKGSTDVRGWALSWTYPGVAPRSVPKVSNGWNAAVASEGDGGRAVGVEQSRVIPAGGSTTIGYLGSLPSGAPPAPGGFRLNDVACR